MRRVLTGLAAGLLLGGAGCRHCCGDRPRLFDSLRHREPECRENSSPVGRPAVGQKLGTPVRSQETGLYSGPAVYPVLPTYTAPIETRPAPTDLLPPPSTIPPTAVPLSPPSPAVPGASLLPAPSVQPAGR